MDPFGERPQYNFSADAALPFVMAGFADKSRVKTQLTMLRFNGLVNRIGGQQMRANLFWFSDGAMGED
jgi:hypothetical protein